MKALCFLMVTAAFSGAAGLRAETDFRDLDAEERAILQAEIRAVLRAWPEIAAPVHGVVPRPLPGEIYAEKIDEDQALIERFSDRLFAGEADGFGPPDAKARLALIVRETCPECRRAERELRELAKHYDLRVTLLNIEENPDLSEALGVDRLPFYVMPGMMLRGHIPAPVLARYLENGTGQ